jgi:rhodanese-related sulfurtransferase
LFFEFFFALPVMLDFAKISSGGYIMQRLSVMFLMAVVALTAGWSVSAVAAEEGPYNYLTAEALKVKLESKEALTLLDIQVEQEYGEHHIPGAVATHAYPVKSDDERGRLDALLPQLQANADAIVIVCPRGAGGAKRAYDHLLGRGIAPERLVILEKGQERWPYPELTVKIGK